MAERLDNLRAAGLSRAELPVYDHPAEHLRDEIYRVWLAVEVELRRAWERGRLRRDPARPELVTHEEAEAILADVHADYGNRDPAAPGQGARAAREQLLRRAARIDARAEATLAGGRRLPLHELTARLRLAPAERSLLVLCAAPLLDPRLLPILRLLAGEPGLRGFSRPLLVGLAGGSPIERAARAGDLAAGSPLVDLGLVVEGAGGEVAAAPRVLALLAGATGLDPELAGRAELRAQPEPGQFPPGLVDRAAAALGARAPLCLLISGAPGSGKLLLVEEAAARLGRRVLAADAGAIGAADRAPPRWMAALAREALLAGAVLAVRGAGAAIARALVPRVRAPIALISPAAGQRWPAPAVPLSLPAVDPAARAAIWRREAPEIDGEAADGLARLYAITGAGIAQVVAAVRAMGPVGLETLIAEIEARIGRR
jgi:hypothetical protein